MLITKQHAQIAQTAFGHFIEYFCFLRCPLDRRRVIFHAAERDDAVLFLDESDSLLSKRLTNVTDGSAQAINSIRSQLLICLE